MNRKQIIEKWDGMSPRERDAWVAEVVFEQRVDNGVGCPFAESFPGDHFFVISGGDVRKLPNYTTDISAAWKVFECHPYVEAARIPGTVTTYGVRINNSNDGTVLAMTQKPTFPEAICLAALIAKLPDSTK
ncbi:hypothetical protein NQ117_05565 [Paenibacillus sp. SC116]|uniref:BC1872 family protein n=1 Tax=Paenibacillus sp. SC116 TaxID=2968986 RepID=UPI00215AC238|nr:hypothetical protein [Paenibacillus sp. SC116]MCR8843141.1 hypothetical protein [Paenibacillus sp. SC116]